MIPAIHQMLLVRNSWINRRWLSTNNSATSDLSTAQLTKISICIRCNWCCNNIVNTIVLCNWVIDIITYFPNWLVFLELKRFQNFKYVNERQIEKIIYDKSIVKSLHTFGNAIMFNGKQGYCSGFLSIFFICLMYVFALW